MNSSRKDEMSRPAGVPSDGLRPAAGGKPSVGGASHEASLVAGAAGLSGQVGQAGQQAGQDLKEARQAQQNEEFLAAVSGLDAQRARAVAERMRRVVMSSQGVLAEQKQGMSRARALTLAGVLILLLLLAPSVWEASAMFIAGEHLGDPGSQLALWGTIGSAAMLAVALMVGRRKGRD